MKTSRFLVFLALPMILAGCGGSGGSSRRIGVIASHYTAVYSSTDSRAFSGTADLTIGSDDQISGTTTDSRFGTGTVQTGSLNEDGRLSLNVSYSAESPAVTTVTSASLTLRTGGVLTGSGRETQASVTNAVTITLTPVSGG